MTTESPELAPAPETPGTAPDAIPETAPASPTAADAPTPDPAEADATPTASDDAAPDYAGLVLPEGYTAADPQMARALSLFGEHRLPPGVAQALVDFAAQRDRDAAATQAGAWSDLVGAWQRTLRADLAASPEFTGAAHGGDRLKEMQALAARAIDAYGGRDAAALREHFATYALGDHPAFARFLARAGRSVREDRLPRSGDGNARLSVAETLYPNQGKE